MMKILAPLFLACALAISLQAAAPTPTPATAFAEVKLTTGEVLTDVKFLSQTPTHVTFKTSKGMRQIDKRKLPDDLQKQFPYDAEAAERRKAALAEAETKRLADLEAKKSAPPAVPKAAPVNKYVKNGVRISYSSDPEGSGPIITLVNDSDHDQDFSKTEILAKMIDDRVYPLRIASRGDKIEGGGKMVIIGDILKVMRHDRLEFRGYFISNYREIKHTVADVFWGQTPTP